MSKCREETELVPLVVALEVVVGPAEDEWEAPPWAPAGVVSAPVVVTRSLMCAASPARAGTVLSAGPRWPGNAEAAAANEGEPMRRPEGSKEFKQAYGDNLARLRKIAQRRGARFNTNWARVKKVAGLMTEHWLNQGQYFCPCKQQNDPPIKGKDVLCPCPELGKELRRDSHCHCRLFYAA